MQRGSVLPLLLVTGLVLAIGAGVFFIQFSRTSTVSEAAKPFSPRAIPSVSPQSLAAADDILGLKFEVPPGFKLVRETEEEYFKRAFGNIRKNFNTFILYPPAEFSKAFYVLTGAENNLDKAILTVWVFQNPENLSPKAFYDKYWYYPFVWGDFTSARNNIAPESIEIIGGKEGEYGIVDYREGRPKYIYLPLGDKDLMMQIQLPTENNLTGQEILKSFRFE